MLDLIRDKLREIDPRVYYGGIPESSKDDAWDYLVFMRTSRTRLGSNTGFSDYFEVAVVREEYIQEGLVEQVIAKIEELDGMRVSGTDVEYVYTRKPGTDHVVELARIQFVRPLKRKCG